MKYLKQSFSATLRRALFCLLFLSSCAFAKTIAVTEPDPSAPHFIYEVFTQSFNDSDGDGTGDLEGIRAKLDYIASLGADAIWLTPIFQSPSYHGYDVSDYMTIKSIYGNLTDLQNLIADAHSRGIKILLDVPVNHTSNKHAWFSNQAFYLWSNTPTFLPKQWYKKNGEYYFSSFSSTMPDLNWTNPTVLSNIEAVFNYWTSIGVDGFRLDAAKYLIKGPNGEQNQPGTHTIWQDIVANVKSLKPNTYFVGEVWDSASVIASYYGSGNELTAAFDFPIEGSIRSSISGMNNSDLVNALNTQLSTQTNPYFAAPFAGNHDLDRLATVLNSDLASQKIAALAVFTLPGTPTVYYGDEIGMPSGNLTQYPGDLAKRTPMDWATETTQDKDPNSLLNTYRTLSKLRATLPTLQSGVLSEINAIGTTALSFVREGTGINNSELVVINLGAQAITHQAIYLASANASVGSVPNLVYGSATTEWRAEDELFIDSLPPKQGIIISFPHP